MRFAMMAAGAVGGYVGARLQAAGHDVTYFARGAHLNAIRRNGLKVESAQGDLHLKDINVTDDPGQVAPVDIVLFAVKLWDSEKAALAVRPLIGPSTRVITVQNGVDAVETIEPILGRGNVAAGTAQIATVIASPGVISHTSKFAVLRVGHLDGRADPALDAFVTAAKGAGLDTTLSDDIERDRWIKFVFLTGMSGVTATTRMATGPILADPDTRAFFLQIMREVVAVGRAKGVPLAPDFAEERLLMVERTFPYDMKASMAHDLERGNRLELDWLAGKVVALGRALKIPTPANDAVYAALKLHRMGRP